MKIYIDFDDVLCETAAGLCGLAEREFGRHVPYEQVFQFDLQEVFGLTDSEMARFMELSHEPASLLAYRETPGASAALRALRDGGCQVEIVTGRPAFAHVATEQWLLEHGLSGFPVVYVDKYGRDGLYRHNPGDPPTVTLTQLQSRQYDVAIDDSPTALSYLATWRETRVFVFSRPWNEAYPLAANMRRASAWGALLEGLLGARR